MAEITKHEADMIYLKGNLHIDIHNQPLEDILVHLRDEHKLNITSWVFDAMAREVKEWSVEFLRNEYREVIAGLPVCVHGFIDSDCPYCKWGTD